MSKKEIEKLKLKLGEVGKNLQGSLDKILKRKRHLMSLLLKKRTKLNQIIQTFLILKIKAKLQMRIIKILVINKKDKKKKKHNFTEQDLKEKKIIQFIVVIAIAIFLFAEDEEVVQQVQNAVKENVKKIAGDGEVLR